MTKKLKSPAISLFIMSGGIFLSRAYASLGNQIAAASFRRRVPSSLSSPCGCDSCTDTILDQVATDSDGRYTIRNRINWLMTTPEGGYLPKWDACVRVCNEEFPELCGLECDPIQCNPDPHCGCDSCTESVLKANATDGDRSFSCGSRMSWVMNEGGNLTEYDACVLVSNTEFPEVCGDCDPINCNPEPFAKPSSSPSVSPMSTPAPPPCGCDSCTQNILDRIGTDSDGSYSIDDRINWLMNTPEGGYLTEWDACVSVCNEEFPQLCGQECDPIHCNPDPACGCDSCTEAVLKTVATDGDGSYRCGSRISWLMTTEEGGKLSEYDACVLVSNVEFPGVCGDCDPINCNQAPSTPPPPTPPPSPVTSPQPTPPLGPKCFSVSDCLSRMTLDEKIGQMTQINHQALSSDQIVKTFLLGSLLSGGGGSPAAGNTPADWANMIDRYQAQALSTRLGIPLIYGADAVHGHNNVYGATIFPHNIGLGATRNPALIREVGEVTAKEVYATGVHWTFGPSVAVARDERWGRTYESFGEHPEIATMMTTIIEGYQGVGPNSLSGHDTILATAKHWIADGGTSGGTDQGDSIMSEAELRAIHMPPYPAAIAKGVGAVMPSYSSWNGSKLHGIKYLITDVLKNELNFTGFVISDWGAIDQLPGDYASDVRTVIDAGVDMVMVPDNYQLFTDTLRNEVLAGNINMSRIDDAVKRILTAKFALGLFDHPWANRSKISEFGSAPHRNVARQAVRESLVLLKNDGTLPLPKNLSTIVVAGKSADDIGNQCGGWTITWQGGSGNITPGTTVLKAIENAVSSSTTVTFTKQPNTAVTGDVGIVVIGELPYTEYMGDKNDLSLSPEDQQAVTNVCGNMPCIIILITGRPMIISSQLESANAFIAAWLPGTEGDGIADVLFGDYNFTGKLPMTWPRDMNQVPINVNDSVYDPLFPYGFGLAYT